VDALASVLADQAGAEDDRGSLVVGFRALVYSVTVHPNGPREGFEIEVKGKLSALIGGGLFPEAIRSGGYMVAGAIHPITPLDLGLFTVRRAAG
jgi:site-specific DNA recombinase